MLNEHLHAEVLISIFCMSVTSDNLVFDNVFQQEAGKAVTAHTG